MSEGTIQCRILGPLEIVAADGNRIEVASPIQRRLLAFLLLSRQSTATIEMLADAAWPEDELPAASTVRYHLSMLRDALSPGRDRGDLGPIASVPGGYRLTGARLDAAEFEDLARQGRDLLVEDPKRAGEILKRGLGLWRGPALADFRYEEFAQVSARRLEELRLGCLEDRIGADLACGAGPELVAEVKDLVERHPYRERLRGHLMVALYRSGRQVEALRVYREARRLLGDELGIDPMPELAAIEERVLLHDASLDGTPAEPGGRTRLPVPLTQIVGRSEEIKTLTEAVGTQRLVTVTGPGGVGKSHLSIATAHRIAGDYDGGASIVEFADASPGDDLIGRIGAGTGLTGDSAADPGGPALERLVAHLGGRPHLLLLETCERVVDDLSPVVATLLERCRDLTVLATSRRVLGLAGETVIRLEGLPSGPAPDGPSAAVRLFLDRAAAAGASLPGDAATLSAVSDICDRLDGLPLAIELAAGLAGALDLADLDRHLGERLGMLTASGRSRVERMQSLRATVEWSYEALGDEERHLFDRLSVFAGPFDLAAAEAVGGPDAARLLPVLVNASMVSTIRLGGRLRYRFLDSLRAFGTERLAKGTDRTDARRAHARYVLEQVQTAYNARFSRERSDHAAGLDGMYGDLEAAVAWAAGEDRRLLADLIGRLGWYWEDRRPLAKAIRRIEESLAALPADAVGDRARLLVSRCSADPLSPEAAGWAHQAIELARAGGDTQLEAEAHVSSHHTEWWGTSPECNAPHPAEAAALFAAAGNRWGEALASISRARELLFIDSSNPAGREAGERALALARDAGDDLLVARIEQTLLISRLEEADAPLGELAEVLRSAGTVYARHGDEHGRAWAESMLADVRERQGRFPESLELRREAARLSRDAGDEAMAAVWETAAWRALDALGDAAAARRTIAAGIAYFREQGLTGSCIWAVESAAALMARHGNPETAARLLGAAEQLRADFDMPRPDRDRFVIDRTRADLAAALPEEALERPAETPLTLDQALDLAEAWPGPDIGR